MLSQFIDIFTSNIYSFSSDSDKNDINGLFNMFIGSNYFSKISSNELTINYPIDDILECCNKKYVELPIGFNVPMPYICKNVINGDKLSPTLKIQICHDT